MDGMTPEQRKLRSSAASLTRWALEDDRGAAMKPALAGRLARFERQVDPDSVLEPDERARRAELAKTAYMRGLALKSSRSRQAKKAAGERPGQAA